MTQEYTPTTEQIEDAWVSRYDGEHTSASSNEACVYDAQFDRWIAAHDAQIREEALELNDVEIVKAVADELAAWNFDVAMNSCTTINGATADFSSRSFELLAKRVLNAARKAVAESRELES